jgi:hypothetical protein
VDILIFDRYEIIHSHSNLSIVKKVIPYKVQCRQVSLYNKITPKNLADFGYPVSRPFGFIAPKTLNYLASQSFDFERF